MQALENKIIGIFNEFGIDIDENISNKLGTYYETLLEYNAKFNLTTITEYNEVVIKHFLDSASIIKFSPDIIDGKIIDVGTGAGFPGLVIAILCRGLGVTLVEASKKKVDFLQIVCKKLSLNNVKIVNGRIEEIGRDTRYREKFDFSVSRAVARLNILVEYLLPLVSCGGGVICYKSGNYKEELREAENAISILGGEYKNTFAFELPENMGERNLVLIGKIRETDSKYPRRVGIPAKRPL